VNHLQDESRSNSIDTYLNNIYTHLEQRSTGFHLSNLCYRIDQGRPNALST
jgi:hypothetical protein